jgi:hydrophobe/amphiphile efflux-1 (HAE1) family protein
VENSGKTHFFVRHWVAALAIAVLTCVIGVVSINTLPVEQYPDIAPPMVTISATYSGADAHAVMESVVMPLEEVVNGVEDMIYMDATASSNGEGEIDIYFKQGTDADEATVNVQNRVSQASGVLPEEVIKAGVAVQKNVNATLLIMSLESTDGKFDQSFISNYLDINVMPAISRIAGVGRTMVMGEQYGVRIWLKPDLMGLYGVTPDEVIDAINEQNLVSPIGRLESSTDKIDIEFNGLLDDMSQFENIIVRASEQGEVLRLRDVADVELGARAYDFRTNINGRPGVMFYVKQAPGANATQVNADIRKVLDEVSHRLPAGLEFKLLETSDDFLFASMYNVQETLVIAILLVVLVVYFFLQDFKATIIPTISIIVSLIGTFAIVKLAGFSLNLLTLFALVLAIGTVVDDAIVVVEAVMAKLESGSKNMRSAVTEAMSEVTAACISTTLVFMAVFIPVTFMSGTAGTFFKQFGITMASAVGLSAVSALTLCPALCAMMLRPHGEDVKKNLGHYVKVAYDTAYERLLGKYMNGVRHMLRHPGLSWLLLAVFSGILALLMAFSQKDLVPQEDQGFLLINVTLPPGTYLNETETTTLMLEEHIQSIDEVEVVGALTGYSMMEDVTSTNYATLMVRLKNWSERSFFSIADVQHEISEWAEMNLPQAEVTAFQMPQIPGYGNGSDISLNLQDRSRGTDKQTFVETCEKFVKKLNARPEVAFANSTYSQDYPKYRLDVDEIACKRAGLSPKTVLQTIGTFLAGSYIGSYVQYSNVYRVMVQAGKEYRMSEATLNNIFVPVGGKMVPVTQFVTLSPDRGAAMEHHFNLFPSYPVSTMPAPGYTSDHVRKAVDEVMAEVCPENYGYEYAGMAREEAESAGSNETLFVYGICLLLIYLIMACLYDSLLIPMAVMLSIPFALVGAYLIIKPLEGMGVGANIYVQTGIIMIIGLVAKTAILITEFAVQKRYEGMSIYDAAVGACHDRLRPIIMTVFAMIMGMVPLALGKGAGAVGNRSLALTVIGGMVAGTLALLFITPTLFIVFQKLHEKMMGKISD